MAKKKEQVFTVIGLGAFGSQVCRVLADSGAKVVAVDSLTDRIDRVKNSVTQAVIMDATSEEGFSKLPLEDTDIAVVAIGDNMEASILSTALLKKAGVRYIIARAISAIHRQVLRQVGADEIINIEEDEGEQLAMRLIAPQILDRIPISKDISIAEVYTPGDFGGQTLIDLDLRSRMRVNVIAIKKNAVELDEQGNPHSNEEILFPDGDYRLDEDDIMLIVGRNQDIEAFNNL